MFTPLGLVSANPTLTTPTLNFTEFRTVVSESFVPLQCSTARPDSFWGRLHGSGADDVHITEVAAGAHVVERTPELIARSDRHYFKLSLQLAGTGLLIQDNREAVMQPGDLAVYDTHRPYTLVFEEDFRNVIVMFPKQLIDLPLHAVAQITAVTMSGRDGLGNIVAPFLSQLVANLEQFERPSGNRLAHSTLDLISTMFASELDLARRLSDPHAALLARIHDYIDENLASADLDPARIAAAHFISPRHLHGLFQEQGSTVSRWIRSRRLDRCRRDLMNPLLRDRPVAAIAARWGFVEAAHFSRAFKSAYGESPRDLRNARLHP